MMNNTYDLFFNGKDSFKSFLLQLKKSLTHNLILAENYGINLNYLHSNHLSLEYLFLYTVVSNKHEGKLLTIIDYLLKPREITFHLSKEEEKEILEKYVINQLT